MEKWLWAAGIAAAAATVSAAITAFLQRRRMRRLMDSLNGMLDSAMEGSFTERSFDESMLSAVEARMARFLASSAVSARNLSAEKDKIKALISDISHQTKTPLANILLYTQLLGEQALPKEQALCVEALSAQAGKLDFLIGALVKMSRLESGILTVVPKPGSVQDLLDAAVQQILPKAEAKGIQIQLEAIDGTACYDPKWSAEAVYNVLDNAVKYAPCQSAVQIRALPYELFFRIDVLDEGPGIPEEEQSKIFARFFRSPSAAAQEGVGIGLYLTREILREGGGYIKVASHPGQGSTFSIFLPTEKR